MLKKQKEIAEGEHGVSSVRCKSLQLFFGRKCVAAPCGKKFFRQNLTNRRPVIAMGV
jgi:hypothetical protein